MILGLIVVLGGKITHQLKNFSTSSVLHPSSERYVACQKSGLCMSLEANSFGNASVGNFWGQSKSAPSLQAQSISRLTFDYVEKAPEDLSTDLDPESLPSHQAIKDYIDAQIADLKEPIISVEEVDISKVPQPITEEKQSSSWNHLLEEHKLHANSFNFQVLQEEVENPSKGKWSFIAGGAHNSASGQSSFSAGKHNNASGEASHSIGWKTNAAGIASHSQGHETTAQGDFSHAQGHKSSTTSQGFAAHAEGIETVASGKGSHSQGHLSIASGKASHAEGFSTKAGGEHSHAEGHRTTTLGRGSHAEGDGTQSLGWGSHSQGLMTIASGSGAHSQGSGSKAVGSFSHAQGLHTEAIGDASFVGGVHNQATAYGESVIGVFAATHSNGTKDNIVAQDRVFTIGNGRSDRDRSNALVIQKSGEAWASGDWHFDRSLSIKRDLKVLGSVITPSDENLKENIHTLENALAQIRKLRGVQYTWKDQRTDRTHYGVITQEVQHAYPDIVYTDDRGLQSLDYRELIGPLLQAVKELDAEVEALKEAKHVTCPIEET